jgi:hypothetical protein
MEEWILGSGLVRWRAASTPVVHLEAMSQQHSDVQPYTLERFIVFMVW